jgi:hypothetical protein
MPTPQEFYDDDLYLIANKSAFSVIRYNMGGQDAHPTRVL